MEQPRVPGSHSLAVLALALGLLAVSAGFGPAPEARAEESSGQKISCGDCNSDGRVNILDALQAAQHLLVPAGGISPLEEGRARSACDINADRRIDMIDVMRLAQANSSLQLAADLPCALAPVRIPVAIAGVRYRHVFDETVIPPGAQVSLVGELPLGLSFLPATREIYGVPVGADSRSFEIDVQLSATPGAAALTRQLAIDHRVVAPPPPVGIDTQVIGAGGAVSGEMVATTVLEVGDVGTGMHDFQAIAVTPRSWRLDSPAILLVVAVEQGLSAVVYPGEPGSSGDVVGQLFAIGDTGRGELVTGVAFVGDACYAVDAGGGLFRLSRLPGGGNEMVLLGSFEELRGATALAVEETGGEPTALVVTMRDTATFRQVARVPLGVADPSRFTLPPASVPGTGAASAVEVTASGIQVVSGASGAAFGAAFAGSDVSGELQLYIRRQPDQLALVSFDAGAPPPRFALPPGSLPVAGGLDSLVALESGSGLVFSVADPTPVGAPHATGGALAGDPTGIWHLPLDGTYRIERLASGFSASQPAGALSVGASSIGTGRSLFVAGNGKIHELFGRAGSETFSF